MWGHSKVHHHDAESQHTYNPADNPSLGGKRGAISSSVSPDFNVCRHFLVQITSDNAFELHRSCF